MSLDFLKRLVNMSGNDIIKKKDVESIIDISFKNLRDEVIPMLADLTKIKDEMFNTSTLLLLEKTLGSKQGKEQVKNLLSVCKGLLSLHNEVKSNINKLPENLTTKYITTRDSSILAICSTISNFTLSILDVGIVMVNKDTNEFSNTVQSQMVTSTTNMTTLIPYIKNLKTELGKIDNLDNEINIQEDNIRLEAILKSKGGLPTLPHSNFEFIGRISYNIGTWLVDNEYKKYEAIKLKRNYLNKRLLELENQLQDKPDDVKLIRAKQVYTNEIEKLNYRLTKMENV